MDKIKYMPIKEFREKGFLQEANRLFFHPLGLAIEVKIDSSGNETLGGMWDYRDDPEGMLFGDNMIDYEKALYINQLRMSKLQARQRTGKCYDDGIQKTY